MKNRQFVFVPFTLALFLLCGLIFAHHGTSASYDMTKLVTLTGTVTEFVWRNPHSQLYFDMADEEGNVVSWAAELNSPASLSRLGWNRRTFQAGDAVTLSLHPSKAGTQVGVVNRDERILVNGEKLPGTGK